MAIRTRKPTQPDLIQRKLFSMASTPIARRNTSSAPVRRARSTNSTRIASSCSAIPRSPAHLPNRNWLIEAGRNGSGPREAYFKVNNILGLVRACQQGLGIAALPDYLVEENSGLVQLFGESDSIQLDTYFVYPEELKTVARVQVFRDSW